jgi:exodeoxyribonuclease-3
MRFTVATWNINSVRLRLPIVRYFLKKYAPDVLCLQETKCPDDRFPHKPFRRLGYEHIGIHGQKGYHGVAILSKHPFSNVGRDSFCGKQDARHISAVFDGAAGLAQPLTVHNFYIPAGGDEPNPQINPKFAHKLEFLDELKTYTACRDSVGGARALMVGDLNVAPLEHDVWSHRQMLRVVSHTPIEVEKFGALQQAGGWIDVMRGFVPEPAKLYTWWSYRAQDWAASNRGRRLDHIWTSPALAGAARELKVLRGARGWARPSDHVPVLATFEV